MHMWVHAAATMWIFTWTFVNKSAVRSWEGAPIHPAKFVSEYFTINEKNTHENTLVTAQRTLNKGS